MAKCKNMKKTKKESIQLKSTLINMKWDKCVRDANMSNKQLRSSQKNGPFVKWHLLKNFKTYFWEFLTFLPLHPLHTYQKRIFLKYAPGIAPERFIWRRNMVPSVIPNSKFLTDSTIFRHTNCLFSSNMLWSWSFPSCCGLW